MGEFGTTSDNARSKITTKRYVALFIYMATNAVHLEILSNIKSETLKSALRRLIVKRELTEYLCSDKSGNVLGASKELKALFKSEARLVR